MNKSANTAPAVNARTGRSTRRATCVLIITGQRDLRREATPATDFKQNPARHRWKRATYHKTASLSTIPNSITRAPIEAHNETWQVSTLRDRCLPSLICLQPVTTISPMTPAQDCALKLHILATKPNQKSPESTRSLNKTI